MCDLRMAALMFVTGHGIKARTHAHAEIAHFPISPSSDPGNHLASVLGIPRP